MAAMNNGGAGHFAVAAGPGNVRCPQCLQPFRWDTTTVYNEDGLTDLSTITDPLLREEAMHSAYVRCPGPENDEDFPDHFLPLRYVNFGEPLVVGLVGGFQSGKTTYLAMLVDEIDRGGLARYGIDARPVHQRRHDEYRTGTLARLLDEGKALHSTPSASRDIQYAAAYLMTNRAGKTRPVAFFDVGGESLSKMEKRETRFLRALSALIFIVDPEQIRTHLDSMAKPSGQGDQAFTSVLDRLSSVEQGGHDLLPHAAAEVLVKADTLRFEPLIGGWLRAGEGRSPVDPRAVYRESRDVYAYLAQRGAQRWLDPVSRFERCTLHVVSATGGRTNGEENEDGAYVRGLRPRRVLEPLASILAMTDVLDDSTSPRIGR